MLQLLSLSLYHQHKLVILILSSLMMLSQNEEETGQMLIVCRLVYSLSSLSSFIFVRRPLHSLSLSLPLEPSSSDSFWQSTTSSSSSALLLLLLVQKERKATTGRHSIRKLFLNCYGKERENGWKRIMNACLLNFQTWIGRKATEANEIMIFFQHQTLGRNQR